MVVWLNSCDVVWVCVGLLIPTMVMVRQLLLVWQCMDVVERLILNIIIVRLLLRSCVRMVRLLLLSGCSVELLLGVDFARKL